MGWLTGARRTAIAAMAGMTCCLTLGLQPAASSETPGFGLATSEGHLTLKANWPVEPSTSPYLRLAQAQDLAFTAADVTGEPNTSIPLRIQLADNAGDDYRFFKIKGLPDSFALSSGFPTKNAWLVAVKNVDGLRIIPPQEFLGDVALQILLFKGKDDPPQTRNVTVSIQPKGQASDAAVTASVDETIPSVDPQAQTERPSLGTVVKRPIPTEEEDAAMDRASDLLEKADIAAARLIYESLTHKGSGRAAFAMGQTYDPVFLGRFVVEGLKPDIEQATKWYLRAAELGSSEAQARLVALNVER
jgi:hypothetical protein